MGWFFGSVQVLIGLIALFVAWQALRISERVEMDSRRERERADDRQRLMWMQTLLNQLDPVSNARAAESERDYGDGQRWMLTCLAAGGLRDELPLTQSIAERPFSEPWAGMAELRERARQELHERLEHAGDRVYAEQRIG